MPMTPEEKHLAKISMGTYVMDKEFSISHSLRAACQGHVKDFTGVNAPTNLIQNGQNFKWHPTKQDFVKGHLYHMPEAGGAAPPSYGSLIVHGVDKLSVFLLWNKEVWSQALARGDITARTETFAPIPVAVAVPDVVGQDRDTPPLGIPVSRVPSGDVATGIVIGPSTPNNSPQHAEGVEATVEGKTHQLTPLATAAAFGQEIANAQQLQTNTIHGTNMQVAGSGSAPALVDSGQTSAAESSVEIDDDDLERRLAALRGDADENIVYSGAAEVRDVSPPPPARS